MKPLNPESKWNRLREILDALPDTLESDWQGTNHFELTVSDPDADSYWWLIFESRDWGDDDTMPCDTEKGRKVGLLMDLAVIVKSLEDVLFPNPERTMPKDTMTLTDLSPTERAQVRANVMHMTRPEETDAKSLREALSNNRCGARRAYDARYDHADEQEQEEIRKGMEQAVRMQNAKAYGAGMAHVLMAVRDDEHSTLADDSEKRDLPKIRTIQCAICEKTIRYTGKKDKKYCRTCQKALCGL